MRYDNQNRRLCTAHRTDGQPCRGAAINGGTVCAAHGGRAPQVKEAAARRVLDSLVHPALVELRDLIENDATPPGVKLQAIRVVLDRTGFVPSKPIEIITEDALDREIARLTAELATDEDAASYGSASS